MVAEALTIARITELSNLRWKTILQGSRFENNEHMQRMKSTSLDRSSDADKNDNVKEKTERNFNEVGMLILEENMFSLNIVKLEGTPIERYD